MSLRELEQDDSLHHVERDHDVEVVSLASTLNHTLDEMLTSSHGVVVVTGRRNRYEGVVRVETIMAAMRGLQNDGASSSEASS